MGEFITQKYEKLSILSNISVELLKQFLKNLETILGRILEGVHYFTLEEILQVYFGEIFEAILVETTERIIAKIPEGFDIILDGIPAGVP